MITQGIGPTRPPFIVSIEQLRKSFAALDGKPEEWNADQAPRKALEELVTVRAKVRKQFFNHRIMEGEMAVYDEVYGLDEPGSDANAFYAQLTAFVRSMADDPAFAAAAQAMREGYIQRRRGWR